MSIFKKFYGWVVLTLKNPLVKAAVDKLHAEFVNSDEGKNVIQQAKANLAAGTAKESVLQEITAFLKAQIEALAQDPQLRAIVFEYLKDLLLSTLKK